jgi:hypothetical protein
MVSGTAKARNASSDGKFGDADARVVRQPCWFNNDSLYF